MEHFPNVILVACVVLFVRNILVYRHRIRRIEWASSQSRALIDSGSPDFLSPYRSLGSYDAMLFDLRKWTYAQFYPEPGA